jgi:hypothetical protein
MVARLNRPRSDESDLRRQFRLFYKRKRDTTDEYARDLRRVLERFRCREWQVYMFGGMLRDIACFGPSAFPRDIDLVVDDQDISAIRRAFENEVVRRNRFGGLCLSIGQTWKWKVDLWPLSKTWAFQHSDWQGTCTFEDLPRTTFLNVEAVAMRLYTMNGSPRLIYESRFFDGINERVIAINFEPNPYPKMSAVRSLITTLGLEADMSYHLAEYVTKHIGDEDVDQLVSLQHSRYGCTVLPQKWLGRLLAGVRRHVENAPTGKVLPLLPLLETEEATTKVYQKDLMSGAQLSFWRLKSCEARKSIQSRPAKRVSSNVAAFVHQQKAIKRCASNQEEAPLLSYKPSAAPA